MLQNGVANSQHLTGSDTAATADNCYLPDFSTANAVVVLVLISQLIALVLTLASDTSVQGFFVELARSSMLMLWMILTSACVLMLARSVLRRHGVVVATCFSLGMILANIAVVSEAIYWLGYYVEPRGIAGSSGLFPQLRWEFLLRNLLIGLVIALVVLRYFYVTHQWRANVEKETRSRLTALQARIRPHFLFNSMNTIAALTRTDPHAAEQAVEDLADLFRASLGKPGEFISLAEELEVVRVYQRIEEQRLGERLQVSWQIDDIPQAARVPGLTVQPLLENAIYHGIEPLADGGLVEISARVDNDVVALSIVNPVAPAERDRRGEGHQIALDNIRQRLELAYGERASLEIDQSSACFRVTMTFPMVP